MPVSLTSRYAHTSVYEATGADGQPRAAIGIRPSPEAPDPGRIYRHVVTGVETVEFLAWRYYGSSESWWRIADANPLVFPLDLPTGAAVAVPAAEDVGRVFRDRRF